MDKINFINGAEPAISGENLNQIQKNVENAINNIWKTIYPVGALYISKNSISPDTLFGGTWQALTNDYLINLMTNDNLLNFKDIDYTELGITHKIRNGRINSTGTATNTYSNINTINELFDTNITNGEVYRVILSKTIPYKLIIRLWISSSEYQAITIPANTKTLAFTANRDYSKYHLFYDSLTSGQKINVNDLSAMIIPNSGYTYGWIRTA